MDTTTPSTTPRLRHSLLALLTIALLLTTSGGAAALPGADTTNDGWPEPPCVKVGTDPPTVEVGECSGGNTDDGSLVTVDPRTVPPCVKVGTHPPTVEVGNCA